MLKPPICRKQLRVASFPTAHVQTELIHSTLFTSGSEQCPINQFTLHYSREQCLHCSLDRVRPGKKNYFLKIVFYSKN